ncbi:hypothetical protein Tco_0890164 [Tanacetum coccineum]
MTPHQPPRAQRHLWLRQVNQVHILDFEGLTKEMRQGLTDRLKMVYTGAEGQVLFTSYAWRRLFEIQGPLVMEFMLEFFSTCRISDAELGLDVADALCFQLGRGQAPEKVTATDLFYLRSMDEGMTVNVPYLLAQYFDEGLIGLTLIARELSVIDMDELGTPIVDEGVQAILAPVQAPQAPPQAASRTMPQSIMRLEEKVHGLRELG